MRARLFAAAGTAALALAGSVLAASPAMAGTCAAGTGCDTTVTFTVVSGGLSIDTPASLALTGAGATLSLSAASVSGTAGTVTVADQRGSLGLSGWTVSASTSDFTTTDNGGGTIAKSNATGYSGAGTAVSGAPALVPTLAASPVNLGGATAATLISATSALGSNSATYTPTVIVNVPSTSVPGAYTGTLTQTVS